MLKYDFLLSSVPGDREFQRVVVRSVDRYDFLDGFDHELHQEYKPKNNLDFSRKELVSCSIVELCPEFEVTKEYLAYVLQTSLVGAKKFSSKRLKENDKRIDLLQALYRKLDSESYFALERAQIAIRSMLGLYDQEFALVKEIASDVLTLYNKNSSMVSENGKPKKLAERRITRIDKMFLDARIGIDRRVGSDLGNDFKLYLSNIIGLISSDVDDSEKLSGLYNLFNGYSTYLREKEFELDVKHILTTEVTKTREAVNRRTASRVIASISRELLRLERKYAKRA